MKNLYFLIILISLAHSAYSMDQYQLPERRGYEPIGGEILITEDIAGFQAGEYVAPFRLLDIDLRNPSPQLVYSKFHWLYGNLIKELGYDHPHTKLLWQAGIHLTIIDTNLPDDLVTIDSLQSLPKETAENDKPTVEFSLPKWIGKSIQKDSHQPIMQSFAKKGIIVLVVGGIAYGLFKIAKKTGLYTG